MLRLRSGSVVFVAAAGNGGARLEGDLAFDAALRDDVLAGSNVQIGTVPSGPHRGAVTLGGAIHIPRGRINIQSQRFDFDHGDITFDGSWDVNPALDIKLTRQFPDALVVIELRGTPRKPQLRLSSDPAVYDQAQIVSLILTGQPGGWRV